MEIGPFFYLEKAMETGLFFYLCLGVEGWSYRENRIEI